MGARDQRKQKARATRVPAGHAPATPLPEFSAALTSVFDIIHRAITAYRDRDWSQFEKQLDQLTASPIDIVDASVSDITTHVLGLLWQKGWQPADVARTVGNRLDNLHRSWLIRMIATEIGNYPPQTIHDRWTAQLTELRAEPARSEDQLSDWGSEFDRSDAVRYAIEVLGVINYLPPLALLMPPPGRARSGSLTAPDRATSADGRMLAKVRALLAKAESTGFAEEAESYSAKAQELMARYRIDHALLAHPQDDADAPVGVRVSIESPYPQAKALLLQGLAEANACRAIWSPDDGFSTVFGFPDEIEVVELMFTSLLVQGTAAMIREGSANHIVGKNPTRAFRQSFLEAYAARITERLRTVAKDTSAAATAGHDELLPVLVSREQQVEKRMQTVFPEFRSTSMRVGDAAGWVSGTAAADRVTLDR